MADQTYERVVVAGPKAPAAVVFVMMARLKHRHCALKALFVDLSRQGKARATATDDDHIHHIRCHSFSTGVVHARACF
jgi:hypothetical protein